MGFRNGVLGADFMVGEADVGNDRNIAEKIDIKS